MTDTDEPQYRTYHQPDPDDVELREPDEDEDGDGVFEIRMPVVTTGDVRNEGDDPFDREALEGMAEQINTGQIPVFLDHGAHPDLGSRYSATEKAGVWRDAEVETRDADGEDQVVASAVLMDPDTLPPETGTLREMLSRVKSQIERGIPQSTSIGWMDDDDAPGGHDLWETSIVGIPADPRTTDDDVAVAAARDALADVDLDDAERERAIEQFRAVVMGPDANAEGGNAHDSVTDDTNESGGTDADPDDENRDESDGMGEQEYRESMLEMQRQQTETLSALTDLLREEDEGDEEEDDSEENEGDEDEEDEDDEDEQSADAGDDEVQTVKIDGEERNVDDLVEDHRTALSELRSNGLDPDDLDIPDVDGEQDADGEEGDQRDADDTDDEPSFSFTTEDH